MSTHSTISLKLKEDTYQTVYCHWDGYPDHNGLLLCKYYDTYEKVLELISNGNLSTLNKDSSKPEGHSYDTPAEGYTIYYCRDRGDSWEDAKYLISNSFKECTKEGYDYLFIDGEWYLDGEEIINEYKGDQELQFPELQKEKLTLVMEILYIECPKEGALLKQNYLVKNRTQKIDRIKNFPEWQN